MRGVTGSCRGRVGETEQASKVHSLNDLLLCHTRRVRRALAAWSRHDGRAIQLLQCHSSTRESLGEVIHDITGAFWAILEGISFALETTVLHVPAQLVDMGLGQNLPVASVRAVLGEGMAGLGRTRRKVLFVAM